MTASENVTPLSSKNEAVVSNNSNILVGNQNLNNKVNSISTLNIADSYLTTSLKDANIPVNADHSSGGFSDKTRSPLNSAEHRKKRAKIILENLDNIYRENNRGLSSKEVVIAKKGMFGKIKLVFESFDDNLKTIYLKDDNVIRRKLL